ncbi:hypothetical protein QCA50_011675 [Cerrena zonata]|uniref:Glucose-methanol-choline oxidoreductase N-terminal domain-containing protein n=1 Tax=Cerrena zonata TaxID=2478898 RepID=A0AAW0FYW0_9APHY
MLVSLEDVVAQAFDYIVVGGGTAGLPLAVRLSEDPSVSVLVIEAGEANLNHPEILRAGSFIRHFFGGTYVYPYMTSKQAALNNETRPWFRGKGLGGTSAVNFTLWMKPPAEELNDFERLGNRGWNWEDFRRITRKIERFTQPSKEKQRKLGLNCDKWDLGTMGPLSISHPPTISDVDVRFHQTVLDAGIPLAQNPLGGDPSGTFFAPCTYDPATHTRAYPTPSYYLPNRNRPNLKVLVSARCNRLILEKTGDRQSRATGMEFYHSDQTSVVHARREVILSAGTLQSPHILELSGIGKKEVLDKISVPLQVELPGVGENVQEHLLIAVSYELRDDVEFETIDILRDHPELVEKHAQLQLSGKGIFTMGLTNATFVPLETLSARAKDIIQSTKDFILGKLDSYPPALREQYLMQLNRLEKGDPSLEIVTFPGLSTFYNPPTFDKRYITIAVGLNHPFSRGFIHSISADPAVDPEFDPRCLEQEIDLHCMTELVKFTRSLANRPTFRDVFTKEHNPGAAIQTDEDIREWIRNRCSTFWHTAGSCAMLPKASNGVVDANLKVYGTTNVRVADLSIVPLHFTGHSSSFVYYVAEKAAELIKESAPENEKEDRVRARL